MDKRITHVRHDNNKVITHIKGATFTEATADAVSNINRKADSYFVQEVSPRADVHVYNGKYLRSNADSNSKNNLDNLPKF